MEEIKEEILTQLNSQLIRSKYSPEEVVYLVTNSIDQMMDAHKKELNSGRRMYQRGREDMRREINTSIEVAIENLEQIIPFLPENHQRNIERNIINLIKNNANK